MGQPGASGPEGNDPPRPSLRDRQRELTRRVLLDSARVAFTKQRYLDVTIDDITGPAGISRGTFYLHYTKAGILAELLREAMAAPHATTSEQPHVTIIDADLSTGAAIRDWMEPYVRLWRDHLALARAYLESDATDPEMQQLTNEGHAEIISSLADRIQHSCGGLVSSEEARARAAVMIFDLRGLCHFGLTRGVQIDQELGFEAIAQDWLHLLTAPPVHRSGSVETMLETHRPASDPPSPDTPEPRRVSLRDRQREMTRRALLDGARAAFAEHGYTRATIDDIAMRAGASRGTFYLYFTKAEAMRTLMREAVPAEISEDANPDVALRETELTDAAGIRSWMWPYVYTWTHERTVARAYLEGDTTDPDLAAITDEYRNAAIRGIAEHILRVHGPAMSLEEARARACFPTLGLGAFLHHTLGRGLAVDVGIGLDTMVEQWLRLLRTPPRHPTD